MCDFVSVIFPRRGFVACCASVCVCVCVCVFCLSLTSPVSVCSMLCDGMHILQSLIHVFQVAFSYCLMLVFMTFNVWLCLALCVGMGESRVGRGESGAG